MKKRFFIKIKIALPVFFIFIVELTGFSIIIANYFTSKNIISRTANDQIIGIGDLIVEKTANYIKKAAEINEMNGRLIIPLKRNNDFLMKFNEYTIEQFRHVPQIADIFIADNYGNFWMNSRKDDNSISTQIIIRKNDSLLSKNAVDEALKIKQETEADRNKVISLISPYLETAWMHRDKENKVINTENTYNYVYDPRLRPWFKNALQLKKTSWTSPYIFSSSGKLFASGKPGITVSTPIIMNDEMIGVAGVDIVLEELSNFIAGLQIGKTGRAFLINEKTETIALKNYNELLFKGNDNKLVFNKISNISDKAVRDSFESVRKTVSHNENGDFLLSKKTAIQFKTDNVPYIGLYVPFSGDTGLKWYIGIVVPENDFFGTIKRNNLFTLLGSIIFIALIALLTNYFSNKITMPLNLVAEEANKIRNFQVEGKFDVDSVFLEIFRLTEAIKNMKTGLRSFSKYVPTDLVRYLIKSGVEANLGGEYKEVTVMFMDIADFTRISEKMDPRKLVTHLGEYLSELSGIIGVEEGTVDKYIGDSIMAFWNAPQNVENHPLKACIAALKCIQKLTALNQTWVNAGLPPLKCRIGVNTGRVVVGNMGSIERFNYSVIGDAVNLTSRLEGAAKYYGSQIIIGEDTYEYVKNILLTRMLDKVKVKGKTKGVFVYELLGVKKNANQKLLDYINAYESGLKHYFEKEWLKAIGYFEAVLKIKTGDKASSALIIRCRFFSDNPVSDEWDGSYEYYEK